MMMMSDSLARPSGPTDAFLVVWQRVG
jgi:hypothetical protein